ncbi:uncharacterized protein LOC144909015 [Branchiostoma floridae x Branchiostoma belcheri]
MSHQRTGQNWRGGNRRGPNRPTQNPGSVHSRLDRPTQNPGSVHSRLGVPRAGNRRHGPQPGGRRWQNADRGHEREEEGPFLQDARERLEESRRRGLEYEEPAGFQEAMIQDRIFVVENQVYGNQDDPGPPLETAAPSDVDYRRDNGSLQVTVESGHHDVDYRRVQVKTSDSERGSYGKETSPPHHERSPRHEPYRMYPGDYPEVLAHERSAERDFMDPYDRRDVRHETPERTELEHFDIRADRAGEFRDRSQSRTRDDRRQFSQDRTRRSKEFEDDRRRDRSRPRDDDRDRNRHPREDDRERNRNRPSRNVDGESAPNRRSAEPVSDWEAQLRERAREFGRQVEEESRQRGSRERSDPWVDSREERDSHRESWERQRRSRSYDRLGEDTTMYDREQGETYGRGQYRREELVDHSEAPYRHEESYRDDRGYSPPRSPTYDNAAFPTEPLPDGPSTQYLRGEDPPPLQQTGYGSDAYRNFPGDQSPRYALDEFGQPVGNLIHHEEYVRRNPPAGSHDDRIHEDRIHGNRSSSRTPSPVVLHQEEDLYGGWGKGRSSDSLYSAVSSKPGPDLDSRGEYRLADSSPHGGDPYSTDYDAREREYRYEMEQMRGASPEYQPSGDPSRGEQASWNSRQEGRGEQRSWNSRQEKREGRDARASRDAGRRERYAEEKQGTRERDRDTRSRSEREREHSRSRDQGRRDSQNRREQCTSSRVRDRDRRDYEQQSDLQRSLADEINKIRQDPDRADRQRKNEHSRSSRGNSRDRQSERKRSEKSAGSGASRSRTSQQRSSPKPSGKDSRSAKRKRSQSLSPRRKSRGRQDNARGSRSSRDKEGDSRRRRSPRDSRREDSRRGGSRSRKEDTREKRTRRPSPSDQTNRRQQEFGDEESGQMWPLQPPSSVEQASNWALETPQVHDQHTGLPPWQPVGSQGSYREFETDASSVYRSNAQESTGGIGPQTDFHGEGTSTDMPPGERGRTIVEIQPAVETGNAHASDTRTDLWELQNAGAKTQAESLQSQSSPAPQKGATQANLVEIPSFQQAQEMKKQRSKSSLEVPSTPQRFPPSMSFPEKLLILSESYGVRTRQEVENRIHKYEKEVKDGYLNNVTVENSDDKAVEHLGEHLPRGGLWKIKLLRRIVVECLPKKTVEMKNKILWLCKQLLPPEGIKVTEDIFTALLAKRVTKFGLKKAAPSPATGANLQQVEQKQVKNEEKRDMVVEYLQRLGVPATREAVNGMLQNEQMLENIERTFWLPHQDRRLVERYLRQIRVPITPEAVNKIIGNPDILADIKKTFGSSKEGIPSQRGNDDHQTQSSAVATISMATASQEPPASLSMTRKLTPSSSTKSDATEASPYKHLLSSNAPVHQNHPVAPLAMSGSTAASVMYTQPSVHMSQASSMGLQQAQNSNTFGGTTQIHGQHQRQLMQGEGEQQERQQDSAHGGYNERGQQQRQLMHGEGRQQARQLDSSNAGYNKGGQHQRQMDSSRGHYIEGGQQPRQLMHGQGGQQARQQMQGEGGQHQRQLNSLQQTQNNNPYGAPTQIHGQGGQHQGQQMHGEGGQHQRQQDSLHGGYSQGGQQQRQPDSSHVGYIDQQHRAAGQQMHGEVGQHQRQHQGQHAQSGQYLGYDSMVPRSAAAEYHGTVNPGLLPSQQQMYMYASPAAFPPQPGISEQLQHFTAQTPGPAAAMESLESTRVFIMDLFRQVNLAWVPEATVQEILGNRELVEQIQRFRAVGMPLELLVNYLKQCLQLVNRQ